MIQFDKIIDFLQDYGRLYIKNNDVQMRCMLCGDSKKSKSKKRLHVKYENGKAFYNCFNCGRSGTFVELYSELKGVSVSEAIKVLEISDFNDIKNLFTKREVIKEEKDKSVKNHNYILDDCLSLDETPSSYIDKQYKKMLVEFVEKRMVPPEYKIFVAVRGEYKGRIIIPIYKGNDIVYFQGRASDGDAFLKFKNPEVEKSNIIMNIDNFKKDKYVIVTEGVMDAMMVEDFQGTCVLGGSVSDEFLSKIYKCSEKGIIIAVDNDERGEKERKKILEKSKYGKTLKYYVTPNGIKDLNKLKTTYKNIHIYETVVNNSIDYWTLVVRQKI